MQPLALRAPAKDMQPIAYLQLFQLAEKAVELPQRRGGLITCGNAAITFYPGGAGLFEDRRGEDREAARIAERGLVILVDQPLELGHWPVAARAGQWRRQMVDYDRLSPPFGLRPLTGIVDDEWIEVRQGRKHGFREAF